MTFLAWWMVVGLLVMTALIMVEMLAIKLGIREMPKPREGTASKKPLMAVLLILWALFSWPLSLYHYWCASRKGLSLGAYFEEQRALDAEMAKQRFEKRFRDFQALIESGVCMIPAKDLEACRFVEAYWPSGWNVCQWRVSLTVYRGSEEAIQMVGESRTYNTLGRGEVAILRRGADDYEFVHFVEGVELDPTLVVGVLSLKRVPLAEAD